MTVQLVEIPGVDPGWKMVHRVRALRIGERTPVLTAMADLKMRHPDDHEKLLETIRVVASMRRVTNPGRVRKDAKGDEVYEMKGGHSRLFFFYAPDDSIVICTHHYWKAKPSRREQDAEFRRCARMRDAYLSLMPRPGDAGRRTR